MNNRILQREKLFLRARRSRPLFVDSSNQKLDSIEFRVEKGWSRSKNVSQLVKRPKQAEKYNYFVSAH